MKLNPTIWRTCRVLASAPRLQLLRTLFDTQGLCVRELAEHNGLSSNNASTQLRALQARGLISCEHQKLKIIYRAEANDALPEAVQLLETLRACHSESISNRTLIHYATAFTHSRRVKIIHALIWKSLTIPQLVSATGISGPALIRHLEKLQSRGFILINGTTYSIRTPSNAFGRTLLRLIRKTAIPEEAL